MESDILDKEKLFLFMNKYYKDYDENLTQPLTYLDYLDKAVKVINDGYKPRPNIVYSVTDNDRLLKNEKYIKRLASEDREEERNKILTEICDKKIIVPDKYEIEILGKKFEIWKGNTIKGITLRCGFENGDSRLMGDIMLDDTTAHFRVSAMTGAGKSVLVNDLITTNMLEYPPYECLITLADFKIIEFSRYGLEHFAPHVRCIAATEDCDFAISMAEDYERNMKKLYNVFSFIGVQNLKDFRSVTGLTLPRNIWYSDEVTQWFESMTSKQATYVEMLLGSVTRLGRACGYHLGLCSQALSNSISKPILDNFPLGMALRCVESVSVSTIGNNKAFYIRGKGKCIVNKGSGIVAENINFKVPFISSDGRVSVLNETLKSLELLTNKNELQIPHMFYREKDLKESMEADISKYNLKDELIILGDTTRYTNKDIKIEFTRMSPKPSENIIAVSKNPEDLAYFAKLIVTNIKHYSCSSLIFIDADPSLKSMYNPVNDMVSTAEDISQNVREESLWSSIFSIIEIRKEMFKYGLESDNKDAVELCKELGRNATVNDVEKFYVLVYGFDKIRGIGKAQDSRFMNDLKEIVDDAPIYGVHFIFIGTMVSDKIQTLLDSCLHYFIGKLVGKDESRLEVETSKLKDINYIYKHSINGMFKVKKYLTDIKPLKEETIELK